MVELANTIWADGPTGTPAQPPKSQIRAWGTYLEQLHAAAQAGGGLVFQTKLAADAKLSYAADQIAWVVADSTAANNGIYQKQGASGAGSWLRVADLPYSFIKLIDAGAGSANAIIATSSIPAPSAAFSTLFIMNVFEANTGEGTIAINGGTAKPLVTNTGNALAAGYLTAGMLLAFVDDGTNYRLVTDVVSAAIVAAAEASAALAEQWADEDEDVEVTTGQYSARHHALKASGSAGAAAAAGTEIPDAADRAALKAIAHVSTPVAFVRSQHGRGVWIWDPLVPVATHQADTDERRYAAPNAAAVGAWVRSTPEEEPVATQAEAMGAILRARQERLPVLNELPEPEYGFQAILSGPASARLVWSDGETYYDMSNGGVELVPWWLPEGASLHADFENDRYYWDGAVKALSDMTTDHGDGSYTLNFGGWWAAEWSVTVEYTTDWTLATYPVGNLFTWTNASNERWEMLPQASPADKTQARLYHSANFLGLPSTLSPESQTASRSDGRRRVGVSFGAAGGTAKICGDNSLARQSSGPVIAAYSAPTKVSFGRNARFNNGPLNPAELDLHRVTCYPVALSSKKLELATVGTMWPLHFIGDSFLNVSSLKAEVQKLTAPGGYIAYSQWNEGGTSISYQASKFVRETFVGLDGGTYDNTVWWDATLVGVDGGFDGTASEAIDAYRLILSVLKHDRWLYIESNPTLGYSSGVNRVGWDLKNDAMRRFCGPKHFIPVLAGMQAANDGSADDLADVADGLWPRSLRSDATHLNTAGQVVLAALIHAALVDRGWAW